MSKFSHFNQEGRARMVDVSDKDITVRTAVAKSILEVTPEIYRGITEGTVKKGDVLAVAQVSAVMAAKNTAQIIPMCHPLPLSGIDVSFAWETGGAYLLHITTTVKTKGQTGVEMEALTSASAAALTIYDMCKALDKGMVIRETQLMEKTGGKWGDYRRG